MSKQADIFRKKSENKAFDLKHRKTIKFNMQKYDEAFNKGLVQFADLEEAKKNVARIKQKALSNLPAYLLEFERNFNKNGGEVFWAKDAGEANDLILKIVKTNNAKLVVKSKSMTTEEIEINPLLEKHGIEVVETDLGEFIVQVAGEKPYHIVTPAMHKSKEDVAKLFHEKFKTDINSSPEELTAFVRKKLRKNS
jgi:L-lactate dehydrogenase complex protein LldF